MLLLCEKERMRTFSLFCFPAVGSANSVGFFVVHAPAFHENLNFKLHFFPMGLHSVFNILCVHGFRFVLYTCVKSYSIDYKVNGFVIAAKF